MSLKAKIITKLKDKAKTLGVNLSNVRINSLAEKLDAIVDSEDAIEGEIEKLDQVFSFKELAALDDAKRSADRRAAADEDEDGEGEEAGKGAEETSDKGKAKDEGDMPAWFKAHSESQNKVIETLTSKLTALEQSKTTQTRRQQLEAKLKDAPDKFKARTLRDFDRLKIDSDDDFTGYLADVEQDIADEVQANAEAGAVGPRTSGIGGGDLSKVKPASDKELDEAISNLKI